MWTQGSGSVRVAEAWQQRVPAGCRYFTADKLTPAKLAGLIEIFEIRSHSELAPPASVRPPAQNLHLATVRAKDWP
jgi:hypothetical protein